MPKYRIKVAHRDTGKESMFIAEGASAQEVRDQAMKDGWLVGEVVELPSVPVAPPVVPKTRPRPWMNAATALGAILIVLGILSGGLQHANTLGRIEMSSALRESRRQSHIWRDDAATGAMANDLHDMLHEVERMREDMRDNMNDITSWGLFWTGAIVLAFGEMWRRGRQS